ncbi:class I SAM-dependent methyltransferase [Pseudodesulfovibrio alkaliphilus]|nr:class I SAM-dependent methyltransferase [Pseudodesulfovibrio alkaliphilus]
MNPRDKTYSSSIEEATNYMEWLADMARPHLGERVLEVGFGHGALNRKLGPFKEYLGVDLDDDAVEQARQTHPGEEYLAADIAGQRFTEALGERRFDTILCYNVLEHVPDDAAALGNMMRALRPQGRLVLFVPAMPTLYGDLDRLAGHHRRYTLSVLATLLSDLGSVVRLEYVNPLGGIGWWANSFRKHRSLDSASVNWQICVFDKYGVPLSRALTPLFAKFFGQSILCVVKK